MYRYLVDDNDLDNINVDCLCLKDSMASKWCVEDWQKTLTRLLSENMRDHLETGTKRGCASRGSSWSRVSRTIRSIRECLRMTPDPMESALSATMAPTSSLVLTLTGGRTMSGQASSHVQVSTAELPLFISVWNVQNSDLFLTILGVNYYCNSMISSITLKDCMISL